MSVIQLSQRLCKIGAKFTIDKQIVQNPIDMT